VLRLSDEQMASLGADMRERYEERLAADMVRQHAGTDPGDAHVRVAARVQAAVAAGVTDEAAVTRYVSTTFALDPVPAPPSPPAPRTRTEQRQDPAAQSSRTVGSSVQSCLTFLGIELTDDEGHPIPDEPFVAELPDGSTRRGLTGGDGRALLVGVPAGTCTVSFPKMPGVREG
jgi:hypothetical protein